MELIQRILEFLGCRPKFRERLDSVRIQLDVLKADVRGRMSVIDDRLAALEAERADLSDFDVEISRVFRLTV